MLPAITAPVITLPDHRAVYSAGCGHPQPGRGLSGMWTKTTRGRKTGII